MTEIKTEKMDNSEKNAEKGKYTYAVGRRKTSHATVRLFKGKGEITINDKPVLVYFPTLNLQKNIFTPLEITNNLKNFDITAKVFGSGKIAQSDAVKLGIARALVEINEEYRKILKAEGCLKRDPRMRERKKPGLRRARRAPQWSKR